MDTFSREQQFVVLLIIFGMTFLYFHSIDQPDGRQSGVISQLPIDLPSANHPRPDPPPSMGRGFEGKNLSGAQLLTLNRPVNINTAKVRNLEAIPGIGQKTAEKIVSYRKEHGTFAKIEDIMKVPGIKEKRFEKIKRYLAVK